MLSVLVRLLGVSCYLWADERWAEGSERMEQFLVESQFETAWSFSQGLTAIDKNSKFGYLNTGGQLVIPHQFPFFSQFF